MLSANFARYEFECKCRACLMTTTIEANLRKLCENVLQPIRDHFGKAVTVTCGYRCKKHNAAIGGAPKSYHMDGRAADIHIHGVHPKVVFEWVRDNLKAANGVILYPDPEDFFVHVDQRPGARWVDAEG
jgi:uncharacterized protein YcbK (DUF882 family)